MIDPRDSLFDKDERHARQRRLADVSFEAASVEYLMKTLKLIPGPLKDLKRAHANRTGFYGVSYEEFNSEYPTFPLYLGANRLDGAKLHTDPKCFLPALFKSFDKTPFVTGYETFFESAEQRSGGRPVGLVFPRRGIMRRLIIHNGENLDQLNFHGLVLVYHGGSRKNPHRLFVQPFQNLAEAIHDKGRGWEP